jgi:hypothetical protein
MQWFTVRRSSTAEQDASIECCGAQCSTPPNECREGSGKAGLDRAAYERPDSAAAAESATYQRWDCWSGRVHTIVCLIVYSKAARWTLHTGLCDVGWFWVGTATVPFHTRPKSLLSACVSAGRCQSPCSVFGVLWTGANSARKCTGMSSIGRIKHEYG